jgi:hypothetical protein
MEEGKAMTKKKENDPALEAFLQAGDKIQEAIKGLPDWDACLALILALADRLVGGNSEEGECTVALSKLAQTMKVLGDVVLEHIHGGGDDYDNDDGERDPKPLPPSPDLLRKLLEGRRTTKVGNVR